MDGLQEGTVLHVTTRDAHVTKARQGRGAVSGNPAGGWCWKEKVWVEGEKSDWESPGLKRKAETDRKEETVMVVGG